MQASSSRSCSPYGPPSSAVGRVQGARCGIRILNSEVIAEVSILLFLQSLHEAYFGPVPCLVTKAQLGIGAMQPCQRGHDFHNYMTVSHLRFVSI